MGDRDFIFWHRWLLAVCGIVIVFGLVMALLSWSPLFGIFNGMVDSVFWPGAVPDAAIEEYRLWVHGMLGATMAGWGITLSYVVLYPFRKKELWAWKAVVVGLVVWFAVDTLMSAYTHAYFNVGINLLLMMAAGIPLLMTRKSFS